MKNVFPRAPPSSSQLSEQQQLMQMLKSNPQMMKKYQQQVTKMQSKQKGKGMQQPMSSKEYSQKQKQNQIQKHLDQQGGLIILPSQGFVLKLLDKRTNQKIFINIVKHQAVDHPQEKQLIDFDNQLGLRIPMSMGIIREDRDKNGNVCKVVDVVMNPKIIDTAQTNPDIFQFMAQIIANYLLEKYKIAVSQQMMKKVKGLKYKGTTMQIQRVKAKKAPKIQQLSQQQLQNQKQKESEQQKLFNQISGDYDRKKQIVCPEFKIYITCLDGTKDQYYFDTFKKQTTKQISIQIDLSLLIHSRGIHLQGSKNVIYLQVKGFYELGLKMPIQIETYQAKFCLKRRKLYLYGQPKIINSQLDQNIQTKDEKINFNQLSQKLQTKSINIQFQNDLLDELV